MESNKVKATAERKAMDEIFIKGNIPKPKHPRKKVSSLPEAAA